MYPVTETLIKHARERNKNGLNMELLSVSEEQLTGIEAIIKDVDSFYEMHDQDRARIWSLRHRWMRCCPEVLPKLLNCIDWNNKDVISDAVCLLKDWPKLPVEKALELLDFAFADQEVRSFSVKCLEDVRYKICRYQTKLFTLFVAFSDEDLLLYLLQLVQAMKHELYLDCDLVKFLLHRALNNQKIGHYLFWYLR